MCNRPGALGQGPHISKLSASSPIGRNLLYMAMGRALVAFLVTPHIHYIECMTLGRARCLVLTGAVWDGVRSLYHAACLV